MKLYYYREPNASNFGDDLNPWLWSQLIGELLDDDESQLLVGIGTILDRKVPRQPEKVVFGSGIGYGRMPRLDDSWKIYCVRGPLTAAALGLADEMAVTDPALLVRELVLPAPTRVVTTSFMPHHKTIQRVEASGLNLAAVCELIGIAFIDPRRATEEVLRAIRESELLLAEAMHGAIVADALRIPWIPVQLSDEVLAFKWWDWCQSLRLDYTPRLHHLKGGASMETHLAGFLKSLTQERPHLSNAAISNAAAEQLQERLQQMKAQHTAPMGMHACGTALSTVPREGRVRNLDVLKVEPRLYDLHVVAEHIEALARPGSSIVVIDDDWIRGALDEECHAVPFLERHGQYWGPPPDDATAIREIERLHQAGAALVVVARSAFWWLEYYKEFSRYLRSTFRCVQENDRWIAFDLQS